MSRNNVYMNPVLLACLIKAERMLGENPDWQACNERQAHLIGQMPQLREFVLGLPEHMLASIGSTDHEVINAFLAQHNLSVRVEPFDPVSFGTAAVLDLLAKWKVPGHKTRLELIEPGVSRNDSVPGVEMQPQNFRLLQALNGCEVIEPYTDGDIRVLMTISDSLEQGIAALNPAHHAPSSEKLMGLRFPMIEFDQEVDLSWLVDLSCSEGTLTQAVGQAKLRMNEIGAHAKAGAAVRISRSPSELRWIEIKQPFTVGFFVGNTLAVAYYLERDSWKEPPGLGGKGNQGKNVRDTW